MVVGTVIWFGLNRSDETAGRTVHVALTEAEQNLPELIKNEINTRMDYEYSKMAAGDMVSILQDADLEDPVPTKSHLKQYAELMGASYAALLDADEQTVLSVGEPDPVSEEDDMEIESEDDIYTWMTSAQILETGENDVSKFTTKLKDGYYLYYEINNAEASAVEEEVFSWRTIMREMILPDEACYIVISQTDDTVLVHPNKKIIGKKLEDLGYASRDEFLAQFGDAGKDGVAVLTNDLSDLNPTAIEGNTNLGLSRLATGLIGIKGLYILCTVPLHTSLFYITQQTGVLIIFLLASFMALCYICFYFSERRRSEAAGGAIDEATGEAAGNAASESAGTTTGKTANEAVEDSDSIGTYKGFHYHPMWARRLIACCIFVLVGTLLMTVQVQVLTNNTQSRVQDEETAALTKEIRAQTDERREALSEWYDERDVDLANMAAYIINKDASLQTRSALQEISARLQIFELYLFDTSGRVRATTSPYDSLNLHDDEDSRMSRTFLPLLKGTPSRASTPYSQEFIVSDEEEKESSNKKHNNSTNLDDLYVYGGVSIRNDQDLCSGCVGIADIPAKELWGENSGFSVDTLFSTALSWAEGAGVGSKMFLSSAQMGMILGITGLMTLCLVLFFCIGALSRRPRAASEQPDQEGTAGDAAAFASAGDPAGVTSDAADSIANDVANSIANNVADNVANTTAYNIANTTAANSATASPQDTHNTPEEGEEWFTRLTGLDRDKYFFQRWNHDRTPFRLRSPEKKMLLLFQCLLLVVFVLIFFLFITRGTTLNEHSILRSIVTGGWDKGLNLYAITASEMIIIVAITLAAFIHRLIFFIARFSTPRGETICHLIYSVITYAAVLITMYYCLSLFGVQTRTLLASAGILGLVVTFGAQSTIADILAGIFIIFENVIHVGDFISVNGTYGVVQSIGVRMTKIQYYGTTIAVNNADLKSVQNLSAADSRIRCALPVDYNERLSRVLEIVRDEVPTLSEHMWATGYVTTDVRFLGIDAIEGVGPLLLFEVYCDSPTYNRTSRKLREEILLMCERNGIRVAFPHTVVGFDDSRAGGVSDGLYAKAGDFNSDLSAKAGDSDSDPSAKAGDSDNNPSAKAENPDIHA